MPRNTISSDSIKAFQRRNSAEQVATSLDFLTKDVPSTSPKPQPKPSKLKPVTNTENEQISDSALLHSTSSAACNADMVKTCQNVPVLHSPTVFEQFTMHSKESTV